MKLSIVTPWLDCPELLGQYAMAVRGADQVVIVDNGSDPATATLLQRLGTTYIRNDENAQFSRACNHGLERATGDVVLMLNNDVMAAPGWLDRVRAHVIEDAFYGPAVGYVTVAQQPMMYLEGWCIAAPRHVWQAVGGFDADVFPMYSSDVDLCWRAFQVGYPLRHRRWPVQHLSNYTSQRTPGAYDGSAEARQRFAQRVEASR